MDIQNNNVTVQVNAKDLSGRPLRVSDCELFILHFYTDDPKRYLTFSKRDMLMTEFVDEITIPRHQMERLNSGVLQYTYDYLPINHECIYDNVDKEIGDDCENPFHLHHKHHLHENLIHSKPVVTSIYWRNIHHPHPNFPLNSVTLFDIERLQREIDAEKISREKDIQDLSAQFGEGFSDKLDAEIERSKNEDARINATLEALGLTLGELGGNVGDNQEENKAEITQNKVDLAAEIARATAKETALQQAIDGEISRAKSQEEIIATSLQMEKERATANESNINDRLVSLTDRFDAYKELSSETLKSEIERAKATESALNEKIQNVANDLATETSRAAQKDIEHTNLVVTEANRAEAVENKIATDLETEINRAKDAEKHILDEVHSVQDTVSNLATADNTYKKSEVDKLVNGVKNDLSTLENTVNNHLANGEELSAKVSQLALDVDKAKSDILAEVAKCDAENGKLATDIQTLSDSVYNKSEVDSKVNDLNVSISSLENWKNNHSDNTDELNAKVAKLVSDTEKLSTDLSTETTARLNADTVLETKVSVAEGKVDAEVERAKAKEDLIESKIDSFKSDAEAKHSELSDSINDVNANLTLEIARAKASEKVLSDAVEIINGDVETSGSIKKSLADSKAYTDAEISKLSLAKDAEIADTLKSYATNAEVVKKISDVIGTAPEALDTLGKIANILEQDDDAISAINEVLAGKANSEDVYTKSEIDTKTTSIENAISTLETKTDNADVTINGRIDDLVAKVNANETASNSSIEAVQASLDAEVVRAKAEEKKISDKIDSKTDELNTKVSDLTAKVIEDIAKSDAKDTEIDANIAALNTLLANVEKKVDDEVIRATEKDNELVAKDTALEAKIDANTLAIETEVNRSKQVEKELNDKINGLDIPTVDFTEVNSSISSLNDKVDSEIVRAKAVEDSLTTSIADEIVRAKAAEKELNDKISSIDLDGANSAISAVNDKIDAEVTRAKASEKVNADNIASLQTNVASLQDSVNAQSTKDIEIEAKVNANETAISDEVTRAKASEKALSDKIDAIEIPTVDFTEVNNAIATLETKVDNADSTINSRIDSLGTKVDAIEASVNAIDLTPINNAVSTIETNLSNEVSRAQNAEKINSDNIASLQGSVSGLNDSVVALNASLTQLSADSVAKDSQIESDLATEKTRAENAESALDAKISVINGDKDVVGSIAHAVEEAKHYSDEKFQPKGDYLTEHQDISNLTTKNEVNDAIQKVVGAAPLALDTLEEIANKLSDNDDAVAAIVNTLSEKANSDDVYTKSEINLKTTSIENAISTLETKSDNADSTINGRIDNEVVRAKAVEESLATSIADEAARAKQAEKEINVKISSIDLDVANSAISIVNDKIDAEVTRAKASEKENADNIVSLQTNVASLQDSVNANETAISDEVSRAEASEKTLSDKIDAVEASVNAIDLTPINNAVSTIDTKVDTLIDEKADKSETYTKSQVDEAIANAISNVLDGFESILATEIYDLFND